MQSTLFNPNKDSDSEKKLLDLGKKLDDMENRFRTSFDDLKTRLAASQKLSQALPILEETTASTASAPTPKF